MKLNTVIRLPDGREGTICWNHLDGSGGIWGRHRFEMPHSGFGDLPEPEFILREAYKNYCAEVHIVTTSNVWD